MIRSELIQKIADENPHLYQRDVERIVNTIFDEVTDAMARGDRVELRGFGAFSVKKRDARIGRNPRTGATVDVEEKHVPFFKTGKLLRVRRGMAHQIEELTHHPVSGVSFDGFTFPHWKEIERVACDAHAMFPEMGLIGWDMAVGPDGPVIIEANDNPFHNLYQITHDRGVRHPEMDEAFTRAAARSQSILRNKIDVFQARQKVRAGKA